MKKNTKKLILSFLPGIIIGIVIFLATKFNTEIKFAYPILWLAYFALFGILISSFIYLHSKKLPIILTYIIFVIFSIYSSYNWVRKGNFDPSDFGVIIYPLTALQGSLVNISLLVAIHLLSIKILKKYRN